MPSGDHTPAPDTDRLLPADAPVLPTEAPAIPGFADLQPLARGAHTVVYRARQDRLDRVVALKVLPASAADHPRRVAHFEREARLAIRLSHPNIVAAFDHGVHAGHHWLALEYLDGHSLETLLARGGAMDERRAVRLVLQVAEALAYLAEAGIVHRDIKPANVVLHQRGVAKLCDLGFARAVDEPDLDEEGFTLGTPNYISPEQARGTTAVDARSDCYSLGATFYHMVTGEPPFAGANAADIMARHIAEAPVPPRARSGASEELSWIIERLLAKAPEDRYPSPAALVRDLEEYAAGTFRVPSRVASESSLRLLRVRPAIPVAEPAAPLAAEPPAPRRRWRRR